MIDLWTELMRFSVTNAVNGWNGFYDALDFVGARGSADWMQDQANANGTDDLFHDRRYDLDAVIANEGL